MTRVFKNRIDELREQLSDQKDYIFFLETLNKDYVERINKAIEHIYKCCYDEKKTTQIDDLWGEELEELVNILRGDE